ncbi:modulator of levamisole receptor-1 domain-containing protein [Ditylenchus destructor]|nr:modulator of levamisole receptor-1 domain-containing protein [Ditylenchus destructor]
MKTFNFFALITVISLLFLHVQGWLIFPEYAENQPNHPEFSQASSEEQKMELKPEKFRLIPAAEVPTGRFGRHRRYLCKTFTRHHLCHLNCHTDLNNSHVLDPSELYDNCEKVQIDYELNELELQTRVNHSHDPCERTGLRGTVVIAKNGSAADLAEKLYQDIYPQANSSCQKSFVLVYSFDSDVFNWRFGSDSPISGREVKVLVDKTREDLEEDQRLNLTTIISIIRSGAMEKINARNEIPNPVFDYKKCGLRYPGLVCDPDGIATQSYRHALDYKLKQLQNRTKIRRNYDACDEAGAMWIYIVVNRTVPVNISSYLFNKWNLNYHCYTFISVFSIVTKTVDSTRGPPIIVENKRYDAKSMNSTTYFMRWIQNGLMEYRSAKNSVWKWKNWFLYIFRAALVVGFVGNVICIITIFFSELIQGYINKYLFVMLLVDMLFNVWVLGRPVREAMQQWNYWWCMFFNLLWDSFTCASCNVLVILTMERFFAIVFPLQHMRYSHVNRWTLMLILLLPVQLWAIYLHVFFPYFYSSSVNVFKDNFCRVSYTIKLSIPFIISQYFLPLFAVALVNITIAIKMGITLKNTKKSDTNTILWMLPTVYALLSIPNATDIFGLQRLVFPTSWYKFPTSHVIFVVNHVFQHLYILNFAYNWLLYAVIRTTKIATMDNGTMVESFKFLNYYQLAKKSLVSKRFRNVIQTHRHSLPRLRVDRICMDRIDATEGSTETRIEIFNAEFSPEAYDEWVIRNRYSKQVPLESQVAGNETTHNDSTVYRLCAHTFYEDPKFITTVLDARAELNHENWPLFQHFVRLLSDPFVYIDNLCLSSQNDVLNLLAGAINPDRGRLRCNELYFEPHGNIQKFISWIKDHICCISFIVSDCMDSNHDQELLNFFLTGAHCTSAVSVSFSGIVVDFVKKFLDFKNCDEYQLVQSIETSIVDDDKEIQDAQVLKREYSKFIVKEEYDEDDDSTTYVFEFNNDDIEKKLQLILHL